MKFLITLTCVLCTTLSQCSAASDKLPPPPSKSTDGAATLKLSDYDVLFKRNIFSREQPRPKGAYVEPRKTEVVEKKEEKPVGPKLEADIVLIGIVVKDDQPVAFLEDRRSGKALSAKSGDTLAGGKVGAITTGALEFISGGKNAKVAIGHNLEGVEPVSKAVETVSPAAPASAGASTTGSNATGGAGAADDANLSIVEKLRRKRLKELSK